MPYEVVFESLRPQDNRGPGQRDQPLLVRMDERLFASMQKLCEAAGYCGLSADTVFHPSARGDWTVLVGALRRGLDMAKRMSGQPFDTFRTPAAQAKVEAVIRLAQLGLGLRMSRGRQLNLDEVKTPPTPGPRYLAGVFRPRAED